MMKIMTTTTVMILRHGDDGDDVRASAKECEAVLAAVQQ